MINNWIAILCVSLPLSMVCYFDNEVAKQQLSILTSNLENLSQILPINPVQKNKPIESSEALKLLGKAIEENDVPKVDEILKEIPNIKNVINMPIAGTIYQMPPLIYALDAAKKNGDNRIAHKLIDYGADVNVSDDIGRTALMYAIDYTAAKNDKTIIKKLIKKGAEVNAKSGGNQITPLMYLAKKKDLSRSILDLLIDNYADIHAQDSKKYTALIYAIDYAIESGNTENIKELIKNGAQVNELIGPNNITPLMYLVQKRNMPEDILRLLIDNGADVNAQDSQKHTALMYAIDYAIKSEDLQNLEIFLKVSKLQPTQKDINYANNWYTQEKEEIIKDITFMLKKHIDKDKTEQSK